MIDAIQIIYVFKLYQFTSVSCSLEKHAVIQISTLTVLFEIYGGDAGPSISCSNGMSGESSLSHEVDTSGAEERNAPPDEQKSLHTLLQGEIEKLCQILELSVYILNFSFLVLQTCLVHLLKDYSAMQ